MWIEHPSTLVERYDSRRGSGQGYRDFVLRLQAALPGTTLTGNAPSEIQKQRAAESATRRSMVGSGDRSDKVRTYNFPQDRVTDHRIGKTVHNLPAVMDGELDELIDALIMADQADRLANLVGADDAA